MITESDHALAQQIFRNNPNCNYWDVLGSYKLQLDSAALSIPIILPKSPSPKSRRPWMPWCPLVRCPNHGRLMVTTLLCPPTRAQAVGCAPQSTVLMTDPAAAEFLELIGCRFLLR